MSLSIGDRRWERKFGEARRTLSEKRSARYVPDRGDAVWITFDSHIGHEQTGTRPAMIVSPKSYNQRSGLAIACAITTSIRDYPFEVRITVGLPVSGAVLADQVRTIDWRARSLRRICALPPGIINEVLDKLTLLVERE